MDLIGNLLKKFGRRLLIFVVVVMVVFVIIVFAEEVDNGVVNVVAELGFKGLQWHGWPEWRALASPYSHSCHPIPGSFFCNWSKILLFILITDTRNSQSNSASGSDMLKFLFVFSS